MRIDSYLERYTRWVIRRRWLVLAASLAVVAAASYGLRYLTVDTGYRIFFSEDNPKLEAFDALQDIYTKNDGIFFVVAPASGEVFEGPVLAAVEELTREAWKIPYATRVDSVTNFQHSRAEEDELVVTDLITDASALSPRDWAEAKRVALGEPRLVNRLISPSGHVTGVNVKLYLSNESNAEVPRAVTEAKRIADEVRAAHPGIDIYLTGIVVLNNAFSEAVIEDVSTLVPLMYLSMFLIMLWLLRSFGAASAAMLVIGFSSAPALGLAGWCGIGVTPPLAQAPTMIMTLALADSVHILTVMFRELRRGATRSDAIVESLRVNFQPVFLTSLTTAIGFLSMNFSDSPPFRHLGNFTAVGVVFAYLHSVCFLPALMAILPLRVRGREEARWPGLVRFSDFVISKRRFLLWGSASVVLAMAAFIPRNQLDDGFINYFDDTTTFRSHTNFTLENLTGIYDIEYSLGAGEEGGISEPDYLAKIDEFAEWHRAQPHVVHVETFTDTMKQLNMNLHDDDPAWYRIPEHRDLAAQYLLLYEMSLPFGLDLNDRINVDKSATRFTVTLDNLSSRELEDLVARGQSWLEKRAPEHMFTHAASTSVIFVDITLRNIKSMLVGTTLALLLISGCLVFALRSVKFGLVSLVPNLAPTALAFGAWGLVDGRVNLGLSVVAGMTLGIVVDDTVHFLSKYLRGRREKGLSPEESVRYTFAAVGPALVGTSLVLVAGFLVLSMSGFVVNADMGRMTAITIAFALLADLLLLPALVIKMENVVSQRKAKTPEVEVPEASFC